MAVQPRNRILATFSAAALLSAGLIAISSTPAFADGAVFVVDKTTTSFVPEPGELSWAIEQANDEPGPDTIDIQVNEIELGSDLPSIDDDLTILGNGVTIDGYNYSYVAFTLSDASAWISDVTVTNPNSPGVYASPSPGDTIVLTNVSVSGAVSYAGISLYAAAGADIQVIGGEVTESNVGIEIGGFNGGTVEITETELVGNIGFGLYASIGSDTSVVIDGVVIAGDATTTNGIESVLYGSASVSVKNTVISGALGQGIVATVFGSSTFELLEGTEVSENGQHGVTIVSSGEVRIDESTIADNEQSGIEIDSLYDGGVLAISRSTVSANREDGIGGENSGESVIEILDSTISGNGNAGVEIDSEAEGRVELRHSTVVDNGGSGVALSAEVTGAFITHSIITLNGVGQSPGSDLVLDATPATLEWSMVGTSTIDPGNPLQPPAVLPSVDGNGVQWGVDDPGLEPLADNGGATHTHLPADTSTALDAGSPAVMGAPMTDQRGLARVSGGAIDIGAVELQIDVPAAPADLPPPPAELAATGAEIVGPLAVALGLFAGGLGLLCYRIARRRVA